MAKVFIKAICLLAAYAMGVIVLLFGTLALIFAPGLAALAWLRILICCVALTIYIFATAVFVYRFRSWGERRTF